MRPVPIVWFERLILSAVTIDLINNLASWSRSAAALSARGIPPDTALILALAFLPTLVGLVLWYFVARRRSDVARWIFAALVLVGTAGFVLAAARGPGAVLQPMFVIGAFAELLKAAAALCLFTAPAAAWFAGRRDPL